MASRRRSLVSFFRLLAPLSRVLACGGGSGGKDGTKAKGTTEVKADTQPADAKADPTAGTPDPAEPMETVLVVYPLAGETAPR